MFEDKVLEADHFSRNEAESPRFVARSPRDEARPPSPGKQRRNSLLHRPVVSAIGAVLLTFALSGGYVYLDYTRHFQSTDDAFITARQTALAPKVSGYITAVPVTDNEHVVT